MNEDRKRTIARLAVVGGVMVLAAGAFAAFGGPSKGTLSGRVTVAGKPVAGGWVVAVSPDGATRTATLSDDGHFAFAAVPKGPVSLGVISPDPARIEQRGKRLSGRSDRLAPEDLGSLQPPNRSKWQAIPTKFEDPRGSGLSTVVEASTVFDVTIP